MSRFNKMAIYFFATSTVFATSAFAGDDAYTYSAENVEDMSEYERMGDFYEREDVREIELPHCSATGARGSNCEITCKPGETAECGGDDNTPAWCDCY